MSANINKWLMSNFEQNMSHLILLYLYNGNKLFVFNSVFPKMDIYTLKKKRNANDSEWTDNVLNRYE